MKRANLLFSLMLVLGAGGVTVGACGDDSATDTSSSSGPGGGEDGSDSDGSDQDGEDDTTSSGSGSDVCLLHNCATDAECAGCSEGRTFCKADEGRCVACGTGGECPEGQECSSFGQCVPEGLECPTDNTGTPTIACTTSADCAACDPRHRVCDPATSACVACTENNTAECGASDICKDGTCTQACAVDCTTDGDCSQCGSAKACTNHKCSECSETYACPAGDYCTENGTCAPICGSIEAPGVCNYDEDCQGCGKLDGGGGEYVCNTPINGGAGQCIPIAPGCEDVGGVALPAPYNQFTNLCSSDANCDNVGVQYNVGKALRDLTGFGDPGDFIEIADANVEYPMPICATILSVPGAGEDPVECGVCVPCREDADCQDIDLDGLLSELFPGLTGVALAAAIDFIFGPNENKLYMYCETVAAGYGACLPCPGLLNDCSLDGGGPIDGSGVCEHPADTEGTALDPSCDDCAATICEFDAFCCEVEWDSFCVEQAADSCGAPSCDPCVSNNGPLDESCGGCVSTVCAEDPFCCDPDGAWDSQCVLQCAECN